MLIVDANVVLRLILNDNKEMVEKSRSLLETQSFLIKREVLAEVVYVLAGVYNTTREDVEKVILELLETEEILVESENIVRYAITTYKSRSLDFVDCLLHAYQDVDGEIVFTFDKKLNKLLSSTSTAGSEQL
jgi:predicted nucleic-acid-binding protein